MNSLAVLSKRVKRFEGKLNICWPKQELARTRSNCVNARRKNTTVLKLAVNSLNLGLCDSCDYFACPLLVAQQTLTFIKEVSGLLIALLMAW